MIKTFLKIGFCVLLISFWNFLSAQSLKEYPHNLDSSSYTKNEKKWRVEVDLSIFGSTIKGTQLSADYFTKPSVGIRLSVNYRIASFVSASIGIGYQQLGAGSVTKLTMPVVGAQPDSTYRQRLRFNTFILPISLHLRTPKDVVKGWKLGGTISLIPLLNSSSHEVFVNIEPTIRSLDVNKDVSDLYFKNDLLFQLAVGPEVETSVGIFKFQFVYTLGTANVYSTIGTAHNEAIGVSIGYLF